jgi:hypothetical protein
VKACEVLREATYTDFHFDSVEIHRCSHCKGDTILRTRARRDSVKA